MTVLSYQQLLEQDRCAKCGHSQAEHSGPKHRGACIANVRATGRQSSYCSCNAFRVIKAALGGTGTGKPLAHDPFSEAGLEPVQSQDETPPEAHP